MVEKSVAGNIFQDNQFHFSLNKRFFYFVLVVIFIAALFILTSGFSRIVKENIHSSIHFCGDGSFPGTCSLNKPYYCSEEGVLTYDSDLCGCPTTGDFTKKDGSCVSSYETNSKTVTLYYVLDSQKNSIDFEVYGGLNSYLSSLKQSIEYSDGEISSRADFKISKMDEEVQRNFIMPLVVRIQNIAPDNKDEQARIAISLVQNIPFGESNETYKFAGQEVVYSRYPYQVLYDNMGVCGEKTELLAFILRELGYGVSFFYYSDENHETLGIKCPLEDSFSYTGYCFVETTGPSIITDSEINYVGVGKLESSPELYFISNGLTFGENGFYEYKDGKKFMRIRSLIEKRGWVGPLNKLIFEKLTKKYGLVDEYYIG